MAAQVTNYQCPACTGPLQFDAQTGKLICEYCGSSYETAEIEALYAEKEQKAQQAFEQEKDKRETASGQTESGTDWGADADDMCAYSCPSCGAELICDKTTAATSCPYCGNPYVVPGQFTGTLKPDYVIPFRIEKKDAIAALKQHYKGKVFLPDAFTKNNHIEEVKGVYVPFWLFDGTADADVRFHATRSHVHVHGEYQTTITEHFEVHREGCVPFERIPVDASIKMPDDYMDSIEPFDYSELKPFSTAYLPGFYADKYDAGIGECEMRVEGRMERTAVDAMASTVTGYETCIPEYHKVHVTRRQVKYALMPVWLLSTKWNGKNYLFAMNGQSGKMVGDLPMSWKKFWAWFAGISALMAAGMSLLMYLL